jgi:hypothetical protein
VEEQNYTNTNALAAHIRSVYQCNADNRTAITDAIQQAKYSADMQYDPAVLGKISKGIGGSSTYYPIIKIKARSAAAWIDKILTTADKPWSIAPTPDPDLDDGAVQQIADAAVTEAQRISSLGLQMTMEDAYDFAQDMRTLIMQQRNSRAADAATVAEVLISDKLAESGFADALTEFISDFALYPAAFMRAKVTMDKVSKVSKFADESGNTVYQRIIKTTEGMHFERINPMRVFPSPGQITINDDNVIIVSLYSLKEISDMKDLPGYNRHEIEQLISECEYLSADTTNTSRDPLDAFPEAKLYSSDNNKYRRASRLAALEFYGTANGKQLKEWCAAGHLHQDDADRFDPTEKVLDETTGKWMYPEPPQMPSADDLAKCGIDFAELKDDEFYNIFAISVHDHVIYCRVTADEPRWLFSASFERNPDSIWGDGIGSLLRYVQVDVNANRRATVNNLTLASYPQVVVNDDIMNQFAPGQRAALVPGKIWHIRNAFSGVSKPVDFFNIPTAYNELAAEFEKQMVIADRVSGIPEYTQGLSSGAKNGAAGTASGLSMLLEAAGNQIKKPIGNLDAGVIKPVIENLYYQLLDDPDVPNDAKGDFKIIALGANGLIFKEQIIQKRRELLSLVMQSPLLQQIIKPEGITALVRATVDDVNLETDDLVPTKAELLEKKAIAEQQAMIQQQAQQAAAAQQTPATPEQLPVQPPTV